MSEQTVGNKNIVETVKIARERADNSVGQVQQETQVAQREVVKLEQDLREIQMADSARTEQERKGKETERKIDEVKGGI